MSASMNMQRQSQVDPTWARTKNEQSLFPPRAAGKRICKKDAGVESCSCRECVFARWAVTPRNTRAALRVGAGSRYSDDESSTSTQSSEPQLNHRFCGFGLVKAVDHFGPVGGGLGPTMTVEAYDMPDGSIEQTLVLDAVLKLSVVEQPTPPHEALVTAYKRDGLDSTRLSEVIYRVRSNSNVRPTSVEELSGSSDQSNHEIIGHGDRTAVGVLLADIARTSSCSLSELVDAVRCVVPLQLGNALGSLLR